MELANIEILVKKYLKAETSLQEETTLKNYFTGGNVAPHLQEYEYLFQYFVDAKEDTFTQTISLKREKSNKKNFKWFSVAASILLLLTVFIGKQEYEKYQAKKIYVQISEGLKLLSTNLKKGEEAVANLYVYEDSVKKIIK